MLLRAALVIAVDLKLTLPGSAGRSQVSTILYLEKLVHKGKWSLLQSHTVMKKKNNQTHETLETAIYFCAVCAQLLVSNFLLGTNSKLLKAEQ